MALIFPFPLFFLLFIHLRPCFRRYRPLLIQQNFLVDAFFPYSAAATAASTLLRSVGGTILPIFAPKMFTTLGYGWGGTLLACISLPIVPAPLVLFLYGERMRERWKFRP
jgi:DHA1 family multidrug resistance protein-like MFS transporter